MSRIWKNCTVAVAAALLLVGAASADPNKPKKPRPHQTVPTGAEDSPQAPVATPAEEQTLENMLSRSAVGLVEVEHTDGSVSMDLEGRFMSVMFASPATDGFLTSACHTGREGLKHLQAASAGQLTQTPTATPLAPTTTAALELK